jgi:hypothetical protein
MNRGIVALCVFGADFSPIADQMTPQSFSDVVGAQRVDRISRRDHSPEFE